MSSPHSQHGLVSRSCSGHPAAGCLSAGLAGQAFPARLCACLFSQLACETRFKILKSRSTGHKHLNWPLQQAALLHVTTVPSAAVRRHGCHILLGADIIDIANLSCSMTETCAVAVCAAMCIAMHFFDHFRAHDRHNALSFIDIAHQGVE